LGEIDGLMASIAALRAALTEISRGHWIDKDGRKFRTREAEIASAALAHEQRGDRP